MKLKLKNLRLGAGRPVIVISESEAEKLTVRINERLLVSHNGNKVIATVDIAKGLLNEGEVSLSEEVVKFLKIKAGDIVDVSLSLEPKSIRLIFRKLKGEELSNEEIYQIIKDIVSNALSEAEIAYFVSGVYEHGMSLRETVALTDSICKTGVNLHWNKKEIFDKHSIGGLAGNRTTPIVVSICAAAGITMPKTSSRAITSAAGTADVVETIARVDFSAKELQRIVKKVGACLAWGGSLGLAPADDKLIRVERLLNLDPESQLIASILAKKLSVGSTHVLLDIPYGPEAKVTLSKAKRLESTFLKVAKHFNLKLKVVLTEGIEPIGNGIGPVLEMNDIIRVLKRENSPKDLEEKCIFLAGEILEMAGKSKSGQGKILAQKILDSGAAFKKFKQIIEAQHGKVRYLKPAKNSFIFRSKSSGRIKRINNKQINYLGRVLGTPGDKSSGIYLHKHLGQTLKSGEPIFTIYAESSKKLKEAKSFLRDNRIISF